MAKFLFTMLPANDLGLPTRLVPIARALADRGHEVAMFNPSPAPAKLIAEAGLTNLPLPSRPMPIPNIDLAPASATWDVEQMLATSIPTKTTCGSDASRFAPLLPVGRLSTQNVVFRSERLVYQLEQERAQSPPALAVGSSE